MYKFQKLMDVATLNIIKTTILQLFPTCKIVLFGSRARSDNQEDSDYDLMIILDKQMSPMEKIPYRTQIRKTLLQYGIFSDILIQSNTEVEQKKKLTGHIVKTIVNEGVEL